MKILVFNLHGKSKITPDWFNLQDPKKVTFLCELGKTLSLDQVKDFLNNCINHGTLNEAIQNTNTIKCESGLNQEQLLDLLVELKNAKNNINNNFYSNIIGRNLDKLKQFLFGKHEEIKYGIKELTLSHDDISGGSLYQVGQHLIDNKSFIQFYINIYEDNKSIKKDQFYILLDFNQLKSNNNVDIVYISPTKFIPNNLLSTYIEVFKHAYIFFDKTQNKPIEAFLNQDSLSEHLDEVKKLLLTDSNYQLYDFGDQHNDIVVGSCRNIEEFDFGYQI